ncbi:MAG: hypothetical protein KC501_37110 [Myxococcales bacterium]|nr:hypothetical protein [Myxococcales bacterium]
MTLRASEMKRLLADSSRMHEPNHAKWIAEAVNALRSTRDPRGAITLLKTIRSHNNRERERRSLDDVLSWIERRLRTEPTVEVGRLMLELGWLRRMSVTRTAARDPRDDGKPRRSNGHGHDRAHRRH